MKPILALLICMGAVGCKHAEVYPKYVFNKCTNKFAVIVDHQKEGDIYLNEEPKYKILADSTIRMFYHGPIIEKYLVGNTSNDRALSGYSAILGYESQYNNLQEAINAYRRLAIRISEEERLDSISRDDRRKHDSIFKCQHSYQ